MGFFDWLFGSGPCCEGNERLKVAIERVIEGTDPRIKGIGDAYERLSPVVAAALHYAHGLVGAMPPCIEMTPEAWGQSPMLRAMFARPGDVANTLSGSHDLREFLGSPQALGIETIHCVVAATRVERTVFGAAMEGDILREDVAQKTVGFSDFRRPKNCCVPASKRSCSRGWFWRHCATLPRTSRMANGWGRIGNCS